MPFLRGSSGGDLYLLIPAVYDRITQSKIPILFIASFAVAVYSLFYISHCLQTETD
jgi:hypothetical protein